MGYRIVNDYGSYEGMKFHDEVEYKTVAEAVKTAIDSRYSVPFIIVRVIDWEATARCPYPDCPVVKYHECPVHGTDSNAVGGSAAPKTL